MRELLIGHYALVHTCVRAVIPYVLVNGGRRGDLFMPPYSLQVLVFSEKKAEVDDIHEYLLLKGVEAVSIHGGRGRDGKGGQTLS